MNFNPTKEETKKVYDELIRFNTEKVGGDGHTPLNIVEYDEGGNIIGGIIGGTYWGWLYVDILWVHENHRRSGIGSKLLAEAEKEERVITAKDEIPKSFILYKENGKYMICFSQISTAALIGRA